MKQIEIYWNDLTTEAQLRLMDLYHENVDNSPLAIIDIEDEVSDIEYEYISTSNIHKSLTHDEVIEFRKWARNNLVPGIDTPSPTYHPIIHDEFKQMCKEVLGG